VFIAGTAAGGHGCKVERRGRFAGRKLFYLRDRLVRPPAVKSVSIAEVSFATFFIRRFNFRRCLPLGNRAKGPLLAPLVQLGRTQVPPKT